MALRDAYLQLRDAFFFVCNSKFPMKPTYLQLRNAFFFVSFVCAMFNSLESISPVDNMAAPGWGVYVSSGSFQWMGRWRFYQEEHKELLSIIDNLNGSTAAHSGRKTRGETSDVIGMWIEITWAKAVAVCMLLSVNLLFSSQITRPRVGQVYEQEGATANRGRRIGLEDHLLFSGERPLRISCSGHGGRRIGLEDHLLFSGERICLVPHSGLSLNRGRRIGLEDDLLFSSETTRFGRGEAQADRAEVSSTAKRGREIGLEDLEGQFGLTRKDAAAQLGVSVSTLKRKCRKHGISRWPDPKEIRDTIHDVLDGEINRSIENDSIPETSETPTIVPVIDQSAMPIVYRNPNPLLVVQPQVPSTQMASENLGGPLVSMQPQVRQMASENLGSPFVFVQPRLPVRQMASENLGSSDNGRTYLALQTQQDTRVVMIKAMYGKDTKLLFQFHVALGIIGLKGEVSKRLKFEVDSFDIKYEDHVGDLILIACDEDLTFYLNVFKPLDDLVFKLDVISKTPN